MSKEEIKEDHCDDYVWGHREFGCKDPLWWFLFVNRQMASIKYRLIGKFGTPVLFADYKGKRIRVVMASRMGDVGITEDLKAEHGYSDRVDIKELNNFSSEE